MAFVLSLADWRDVIVIIYGVMGIIFFVVAALVTLALGLAVRGVIKNVNGIVDENVKPTLASVKEMAETVTGTTEFVGKTAIGPIVKTYSVFAGVKRALGLASALGGKRKK